MMISHVKTPCPPDTTATAAVLAEAFAEYELLYTREAFGATILSEEVIKNRFGEPGSIWVVVSEEKTIGTVSCAPVGDVLYVRSMAAVPGARGAGTERHLLEEIENYAYQNDFKYLTLKTAPFLSRAIPLYKKFGFVAVGNADLMGTPLIIMEKRL